MRSCYSLGWTEIGDSRMAHVAGGLAECKELKELE